MITVTQLAAALSVFDADDKLLTNIVGNVAVYDVNTKYLGFIDLKTGLVKLFKRV